MSGGVDSSVAAALLQRQGYEVVGVFMCLGMAPEQEGRQGGCCSPEDARDARNVAGQLGIQFEVVNFQKEMDTIINYFINEYRHARTPNPCIHCNRQMKFGKLLELALMEDAQFVATGHYARINTHNNQIQLCRGVDSDKDQSYALFEVERNALNQMLLPIGAYHKNEIRELAAGMNLPVHDKSESQEICFVPDDDYVSLLTARAPELCREGPVVNTQGEILGTHQGIFRYTIGQRRGLGIALGEPAYVVRLDARTNTVVLGSREDLMGRKLRASNVNWLIDDVPREKFSATIQIRYNHKGAPGTVKPIIDTDGRVREVDVEFDAPVSAITPGQAAVFYIDGNHQVTGGGWIENGL